MNPEAEPTMPEWKVYCEGNFWGHSGKDHALSLIHIWVVMNPLLVLVGLGVGFEVQNITTILLLVQKMGNRCLLYTSRCV